jgi:hypothetical protein
MLCWTPSGRHGRLFRFPRHPSRWPALLPPTADQPLRASGRTLPGVRAVGAGRPDQEPGRPPAARQLEHPGPDGFAPEPVRRGVRGAGGARARVRRPRVRGERQRLGACLGPAPRISRRSPCRSEVGDDLLRVRREGRGTAGGGPLSQLPGRALHAARGRGFLGGNPRGDAIWLFAHLGSLARSVGATDRAERRPAAVALADAVWRQTRHRERPGGRVGGPSPRRLRARRSHRPPPKCRRHSRPDDRKVRDLHPARFRP